MMRPTLTILDGSNILMKNGPTGGDPSDVKPGNVLLAAVDPVAQDAWAYEHLLERGRRLPAYLFKAEEQRGRARGLAGTDQGDRCEPGAAPEHRALGLALERGCPSTAAAQGAQDAAHHQRAHPVADLLLRAVPARHLGHVDRRASAATRCRCSWRWIRSCRSPRRSPPAHRVSLALAGASSSWGSRSSSAASSATGCARTARCTSSWAGSSTSRQHAEHRQSNRYRPVYQLKYLILAVLLIMASFGALQIGLLDPICLMMRTFTTAFAPAADMAFGRWKTGSRPAGARRHRARRRQVRAGASNRASSSGRSGSASSSSTWWG